MGEFEVPESALYGASTARAVENFPISDLKFSRTFIRSLAEIKKACALVNQKNKLLEKDITTAIVESAQEVIDGKHDDDFVLDIAVVERTIRKSDKRFKGSHIAVEVFDGDILLVGQVPSDDLKEKATIETRKLKKAKNGIVYNYLQVAPPTTLLARTNDAYITTKVKAKLIASGLSAKTDTSNRKIKVLTEDGTVYLMGVINESNSDGITSLVKSVYGVRQIVNLFKELN